MSVTDREAAEPVGLPAKSRSFWQQPVVLLVLLLLVGAAIGAGITLRDMMHVETGMRATANPNLPRGEDGVVGPEPPPPINEPQPEVSIDSTTYNFGSMESGEKGSHDFVVKNIGKGPLKLFKGETTCKCTMSEVAAGEIPPGGEAKITLTWEAKSATPAFRQTAVIHTTDRKKLRLVLNIEGTLQESIVYMPALANFGAMLTTEEKTTKVQIYTHRVDKLEFSPPRLTSPETADHYVVALEDMPESDRLLLDARAGKVLSVTVKPGLKAGEMRQSIELESNVKPGVKQLIPVVGTIAGDVSILGKGYVSWSGNRGVVNFGVIPHGKGASSNLKIWVRGSRRENLELSVGEVLPPQLKVTIGPPKSRNNNSATEFALTIEVPADCPPVRLMGNSDLLRQQDPTDLGKVVIRTSHPDIGELHLLVKLAVGG